jgi:hypothetical protein
VSLSFHHLVNAHQFQRLDVYRSIFRDIDDRFANAGQRQVQACKEVEVMLVLAFAS